MDLFGKEPNLYIKGKSKKSSKLGSTLTIIYIIIYIFISLYKLYTVITRKKVTFYDTYAYKDIPSIKLTNEEFYGGFSMGGIIDETIYNIKAQYVRGIKVSDTWEYEYTDLEVETCKLAKFGKKYQNLFKNTSLDNFYCLKNVNLTFEGYSYLNRFSYISLKIFPCIGQAKDGRKCQNYDVILKFFEQNIIEFKIQDNLLTPEFYKTPVQPQEKDITCPIFLKIYQQIYSYIQIVYVETDEDITGLNFFAKNKVEKYSKYSDSFIIATPGSYDILETGGPVCDITLQLAATVLTQRRKYSTLIDILGEVGGLMEFIHSFFNIVSSLIINEIYEKFLVNNLFNFNINRKLILLKQNRRKKQSNEVIKDFEKIDYDKKNITHKNESNDTNDTTNFEI